MNSGFDAIDACHCAGPWLALMGSAGHHEVVVPLTMLTPGAEYDDPPCCRAIRQRRSVGCRRLSTGRELYDRMWLVCNSGK